MPKTALVKELSTYPQCISYVSKKKSSKGTDLVGEKKYYLDMLLQIALSFSLGSLNKFWKAERMFPEVAAFYIFHISPCVLPTFISMLETAAKSMLGFLNCFPKSVSLPMQCKSPGISGLYTSVGSNIQYIENTTICRYLWEGSQELFQLNYSCLRSGYLHIISSAPFLLIASPTAEHRDRVWICITAHLLKCAQLV